MWYRDAVAFGESNAVTSDCATCGVETEGRYRPDGPIDDIVDGPIGGIVDGTIDWR